MALSDRENELLNILSMNKTVTVKGLAKMLYVSLPTVRRDLTALAEKGLILRTHGGAVISKQFSDTYTPLYLRENKNNPEKKLIAEQAAKLLKENCLIMLDASTTAMHLLPYLQDFNNLTVITSGVRTAALLAEAGINTLGTGGHVVKGSYSYTGQDAMQMVRNYTADLFFFSCKGLSPDGMLSDTSVEETDLRREMLKRAKCSALLIDSNKFDADYWYNLCHLSDVDYCFSDKPLPETCGKPRFAQPV